MTDKNKQPEQLAEYRKWLVAAEQKSQEDFDKTILSLSGGALGISFVFLKDVIGTHPIQQSGFLLAAWLAWAFSTFSVLTSYYLSHLALRRAIAQVDDGTIYKQRPGGVFAPWTAVLNAIGAVLFLVGVCSITVFAGINISSKGEPNDRKEAAAPTTSSNTANSPNTASKANPGAGPKTSGDERLHSPATTANPTKK